MKHLLTAVLVALGAFPLSTSAVSARPADNVTEHIAYDQVSPDQYLNIYYPSGTGPFPFVIFVHGGGWTGGHAELGHIIAKGLNPAGYAVVSVEYRKPPAVAADQTVQDIATATAFVLKNAASYQLRPDHFAYLAHSAGSQMVALVGTDPSYAAHAGFDIKTIGVVGVLDGIFDLTAAIQSDDKARKRDHQLDIFGNDPNYWRTLSPVDHVATTSANPLYCIIHEDTVYVFASQAERWVTALNSAKKIVIETNMSGMSHGQLAQDFKNPGSTVAAAFINCLNHSVVGK
jgi:acetyl esterase/lipase